jgi:hypothetical protein
VLLALPVAAVVNVLLGYAHERYTHSRLYAGDRAPILLDTDGATLRDIDAASPDDDHA